MSYSCTGFHDAFGVRRELNEMTIVSVACFVFFAVVNVTPLKGILELRSVFVAALCSPSASLFSRRAVVRCCSAE